MKFCQWCHRLTKRFAIATTEKGGAFVTTCDYSVDNDSVGDMANISLKQKIDVWAALVGSVAELKQGANFVERHVQCTAMADETQTLQMNITVQTIIFRSFVVAPTAAFAVESIGLFAMDIWPALRAHQFSAA